jgi:hypothetical protein
MRQAGIAALIWINIARQGSATIKSALECWQYDWILEFYVKGEDGNLPTQHAVVKRVSPQF